MLPGTRGTCDAIECKWSPASLDPKGMLAFRANYPKGRNFVVSPTGGETSARRVAGLEITFTGPARLRAAIG